MGPSAFFGMHRSEVLKRCESLWNPGFDDDVLMLWV